MLELIQGVYPKIRINDFAIATWMDVLENFEFDACRKAYLEYVRDGGDREPKPADILQVCRRNYRDPDLNIEMQDCPICHGKGVVRVLNNGYECVYSCRCPNGRKYKGLPRFEAEYWTENEFYVKEVAVDD